MRAAEIVNNEVTDQVQMIRNLERITLIGFCVLDVHNDFTATASDDA